MAFEFKLSTDEIREKMFNFIKPVYKNTWDFEVGYINWVYGVYDSEDKFFITYVNSKNDNTKYLLITGNGDIFYVITGVYDKESGIFLTKIYYVSDGIARCGINYHSYIVITDEGNIFKVDHNDEYEKGTYQFSIPKQYEILTDKVKEGIDFYGNDFAYRRCLSEDMRKQLKAIADIMDDRCRRSFPIYCENDAQKLFELANFNIHTILNIYNKKTISDFNKFADDDKIMLWRGDKYLQLLNEITSDIVTNQERCRIFIDACNLFSRGVNDTYDKQFLNAVKCMYEGRIMAFEDALKRYINAYAEEYPDKLKAIVPLIEFVKVHAKSKYLKDAVKKM